MAILVGDDRGDQGEFTYNPRDEMGTQDPLVTLETGSGTCRDYALFMMEAARSLGFAARFVSGYLYDESLTRAARPPWWAAARRMPGCRSICPAPAGWNSTRPTRWSAART